MPRAAFISILALMLAGCATQHGTATVPQATLTPESAAADFGARSLRDEALQRFLAENTQRDPMASWDFEALSWVAFFYHPSLGLARAQWATARSAQATAAARPNPSLTLTPGYNFTREPGISPWFPGINFDFLFPSTEKRLRQQDLARAEAEAARLGVLSAVWQVRAELRRALTELAASARREQVLQTQFAAQEKLVDLVGQRLGAGGATASDLSGHRASLLRTQTALADATSQSSLARVKVAAALGVPAVALAGVVLPAPPMMRPLSAEALLAARNEALRSRTDVLAALAKYRSAHANVELEIAKRMPDFHLGPGYQWDQGASKWSLALSLELPLFHRNEAPVAEALARRAETSAQFTVVQAQVLAAIEAAAAAQASAEQQIGRIRQLRTELTQQQERVRQRLELGVADQLEVQLAGMEVFSTDLLLLDAENAAALASGQLEDALQAPFPRLSTLADAPRATPSATP